LSGIDPTHYVQKPLGGIARDTTVATLQTKTLDDFIVDLLGIADVPEVDPTRSGYNVTLDVSVNKLEIGVDTAVVFTLAVNAGSWSNAKDVNGNAITTPVFKFPSDVDSDGSDTGLDNWQDDYTLQVSYQDGSSSIVTLAKSVGSLLTDSVAKVEWRWSTTLTAAVDTSFDTSPSEHDLSTQFHYAIGDSTAMSGTRPTYNLYASFDTTGSLFGTTSVYSNTGGVHIFTGEVLTAPAKSSLSRFGKVQIKTGSTVVDNDSSVTTLNTGMKLPPTEEITATTTEAIIKGYDPSKDQIRLPKKVVSYQYWEPFTNSGWLTDLYTNVSHTVEVDANDQKTGYYLFSMDGSTVQGAYSYKLNF
jgi:hypothetical protein